MRGEGKSGKMGVETKRECQECKRWSKGGSGVNKTEGEEEQGFKF